MAGESSLAGSRRPDPARTKPVAPRLAGAAVAGCALLLTGSALPDLAVRRDALDHSSGEAIAVVENRGTAPSPETVLELTDRPPIGGPTGTSSPYPALPNETGVWVDQEPAPEGGISLTLRIGRTPRKAPVGGQLTLERGERIVLRRDVPGVDVVDRRTIRWTNESAPPEIEIPLHVPAAPGNPPRISISSDNPGDRLRVVTSLGDEFSLRHILDLDCLERPATGRVRLAVPPLQPGEQARLTTPFQGGALGEFFARVDPDGAVEEFREGNNVAAWHSDRDRRTLGVLHVHSCFSEATGSVDWQVHLASMSGYDLMWWSEHDWRVECIGHLERIRFEAEEPVRMSFPQVGPSAIGDVRGEGASGGEALYLAVRPGARDRVTAALASGRIRYALASEVKLSLRLLARNLGENDRLSVEAELSHHPAERRRLRYDLVREGASPPETAPGDPGPGHDRIIRRPIATGSWVTVQLRLTEDAAATWENGRDNNLIRLLFTLESEGAEVWLDDVEISAEVCGNGLRRVQVDWMDEYPNVAHLFAEEVSWGNPHLNEYGRRRNLGYDEIWEDLSVEATVQRTHEADGVVAWCHPFGARYRKPEYSSPAYRDSLIQERFGGTDVLEVGFRKRASVPLSEYLDYWDIAGRRGVVMTGVGVNDSHGAAWGSWENNFATWLEAPADDEVALLRALRDGRVFFGDPLAFRGRVDIRCGDARGGDIVGGSGPREVTVALTDVAGEVVVRLIADGALRQEWRNLSGTDERTVHFDPDEVRVVRAEVWSALEDPLAFTNPIYFDPDSRMRRSRR